MAFDVNQIIMESIETVCETTNSNNELINETAADTAADYVDQAKLAGKKAISVAKNNLTINPEEVDSAKTGALAAALAAGAGALSLVRRMRNKKKSA